MRYDFEWDPVKARNNLAKHGVPFDIAITVFEDPLLFTKPDAQDRDRWITMGVAKGQLLVVVHTDVEATTDEEHITRIRIISARRATPRERRAYRDQR